MTTQSERRGAELDPLTGLCTRPHLCGLLEGMVDAPTSGTGTFIVIDLDDFRSLNGTFGHQAGDAALIDVADLLRAVTPPGAVVARIGGDEFAVLLPGVTPDVGLATASTLLRAIRHGDRFASRPTPITGSIGVVQVGPDSPMTAQEVLGCADLALDDAKGAGRNRIAVYDPASGRREAMATQQLWLTRLRDPGRHFEAHAQPIVAADVSDTTRRLELLVRYRDDDGRLVPPIEFLPIAERTGLIGHIDRLMLRAAVELILDSRDAIEVAVNLSAQTFVDPTLPAFLDTLAGAGGLPPGCLLIEITETAALADATVVAATVGHLRDRGCRIALDDFGSGFATFNYLQRLDVDVLKIDGGFIRGLHISPTDELIVHSIVSLARSLGLPVIAEQVESPLALQQLLDMGVEYVQGYLFARPVPLAELMAGPAPEMAAFTSAA